MTKYYRQFPRRRGPVIALPSAAPYVPYWIQPVNEPVRGQQKRLARQQPNYTHTPFPALPSEAPYVSYWKQPVNQPLRSRVPKRLQLPPPQPSFPPQTSQAPYVSYWVQPTNQPQVRRKAREIEISGGALNSITEAPYISYWVHPTNQPLRNRIRPQQQPTSEWVPPIFSSSTPTAANDVAMWVHPVHQPFRQRWIKRQQPPEEQIPFVLSRSFIQPTSQPLRSRQSKRQQPRYSTQFMSPLPSQAPYISYWKQSTTQPRIVRKRQQPPSTVANPFYNLAQIIAPSVAAWIHPVNQPMRRKAREIEISGGLLSSTVEAPYLTYWKQPIAQPRITKKRQQPTSEWVPPTFNSNMITAANDVSLWIHPASQPRFKKLRVTSISGKAISSTSQAPYVSYWVQPVNQPRITKRRQQVNRTTGFYTAPAGLQQVPPLSWQRPAINPSRKGTKRQQPQPPVAPIQPIRSWMSLGGRPTVPRKLKRQQPLPNWNPWYETIPNANLVSQWKRNRDQQLATPKKKRQQPANNFGWNYANIYPFFPVPFMSWKQPVQQPLRRSRQTTRYIPNPVIILLASLAVRKTLPIFLSQDDNTIYLSQNDDATTFSNDDNNQLFL